MSLGHTETTRINIPNEVFGIKCAVENLTQCQVSYHALADYMMRRFCDYVLSNRPVNGYAREIADQVMISDLFVTSINDYQKTPLWKQTYKEVQELATLFFTYLLKQAVDCLNYANVVNCKYIFYSTQLKVS